MLKIVGEHIARFENVSGTCLEDARFAVVTKRGIRIPSCRGITLRVNRLDDLGKKLLLEHLRRNTRG